MGDKRREHWHKMVVGGEIVGFIHWAITKDNGRSIYDLVVHPNHRHKGYGTTLVRYIGTPVTVRMVHPFFDAIGFYDNVLPKEPVVVPSGEPWILTYTGKVVNPLDLKPKDICIEDIAHQLACVNRFAGCTMSPINVAQHSVYCSRLVEDTYLDTDEVERTTPKSKKLQLQALLHDAAEAYLGDITKWLKAELPQYIAAEERAMQVILKKFGCSTTIDEAVWRADRVMVMYEGVKGFGKAWDGLHLAVKPGYEPITEDELERIGRWAPWNWRASEEAFLVRYRHCMAK